METPIVIMRPIASLRPHPRNPRVHPPAMIEKLKKSIIEFGWTNPLIVSSDGFVLAGHARMIAAEALGFDSVPVIIVPLTGDKASAYLIADNRIGEDSEWEKVLLKSLMMEIDTGEFDLTLTGFGDKELERMIAPIFQGGNTDPDAVPEVPDVPVTKRGDLIVLGNHRLICGDATDDAAYGRLMGKEKADLVLTDPPYCSGGFQESGKGAGSIGSAQTKKGKKFEKGIINDRLSTRGYLALMRQSLTVARDVAALYLFTDWRMWIHAFDVAESSGFGVRNMIVWNKGTPGMGVGWRTQHELILYGSRTPIKFDNHKAVGNVIDTQRTGNLLHPTQKPVELMQTLLNVSDMAKVVYDPFAGSGSTLVACEAVGRSARLMELAPGFCDVIVKRWEEYAGKKAQRIERKGAKA